MTVFDISFLKASILPPHPLTPSCYCKVAALTSLLCFRKQDVGELGGKRTTVNSPVLSVSKKTSDVHLLLNY